MAEPTKSKISAEVQLCWEVMTCRGMRSTYGGANHPCQFFNAHYGPYPAFDWIDKEPDAPFENGRRTFAAKCVGERFNVPELMSGCRKAPIMTIGINPNLTAFFPGPDGARWGYPYFDNIAQYAEYFRYRSIHQEAFELDFIKQHVVPGTEVKAQEAGILNTSRTDKRTGEVQLVLKYDNSPTPHDLTLKREFEVLWPNASRSGPDKARFIKDDVLAAMIALPKDAPAQIIQEPVGYYQRFESILEKFASQANLGDANLAMGEDVCQGDMVACASPGWGSYLNADERRGIVDECVKTRRYLPLQLIQTQPACVVFSGRAALGMFMEAFPGAIEPSLNVESDPFTLLKRCIDETIWLTFQTLAGPIKARVVVSPHFSYSSNFARRCRFKPEHWQDFKVSFPGAAQKLEDAGVVDKAFSGVMIVDIYASNAPSSSALGASAWQILLEHFMDPPALIASVLTQEYEAGRISLDPTTKHLMRTDGPCEYCDNSLFSLPGGCPYGKIDTSLAPGPSADDLSPSIEMMFNKSS